MRCLLAFLLGFIVCTLDVRAEEPFLKPNDVIALVGGEDMVVANELGYLEVLLQQERPDWHLKIRSLAWEGDTVFEQHRDLNYPTLETQLDQIGATVVICWFGQMESLGGKEKLPEFIAAYQKMIARLAGPHGTRRVLLLFPCDQEGGPAMQELDFSNAKAMAASLERARARRAPYRANLRLYGEAVEKMSAELSLKMVSATGRSPLCTVGLFGEPLVKRDGVHLIDWAQNATALRLANVLLGGKSLEYKYVQSNRSELGVAVAEKNRLWFEYTRPQNWAFLAGDRTNQPSSRDYKDPSKRWFPVEMEEFVPLIEKKDAEIWEAAGRLGGKK